MADAAANADNVASVCMQNRDKVLTSYPSLLGKQKAQTVYPKFSFGDDPSKMLAFDNRLREERLNPPALNFVYVVLSQMVENRDC